MQQFPSRRLWLVRIQDHALLMDKNPLTSMTKKNMSNRITVFQASQLVSRISATMNRINTFFFPTVPAMLHETMISRTFFASRPSCQDMLLLCTLRPDQSANNTICDTITIEQLQYLGWLVSRQNTATVDSEGQEGFLHKK